MRGRVLHFKCCRAVIYIALHNGGLSEDVRDAGLPAYYLGMGKVGHLGMAGNLGLVNSVRRQASSFLFLLWRKTIF